MSWGMVAAAGISAAGGYAASQSASNSMSTTSRSILARQQMFQREMQDKATEQLSPYTEMGHRALGDYENFNTTGTGRSLLDQMNGLEFNTDYQSDPAYQWRLKQQEEMLNRQMASRGSYDSRDAYNMLFDGNMALSGQEADKQYARATDQYNREYGNLMNQYNMEGTQLGDLATMGFNANNSLAGMYVGQTPAMMGALQNAGNMQAQAGQIGAQGLQSLSQLPQNLLDNYNNQNMMNLIQQRMQAPTLGTYNPSYNGGMTPTQWRQQNNLTYQP